MSTINFSRVDNAKFFKTLNKRVNDYFKENKLKKTDVVVVLLHDSGSRYIGKIYNDEWMRKEGFFDKEPAKVNGKKVVAV